MNFSKVINLLLPGKSLPFSQFVLLSGLSAIMVSTTITLISFYILELANLYQLDLSEIGHEPTLLNAIGLILVTPLIETCILIGIIMILKKLSFGDLQACFLSALLWAVLHGLLLIPISFIAVIWSFFIFSYGYLVWSSRSEIKAFCAAFLPHVLLNAFAFLPGFVNI